MHWEDERWIKVYTRDTPEWITLSWQARGIFLLLLRCVDRAGVLNLGRSGKKGLAAMLRVELDVLTDALDELEAVENVRLDGDRLVVPNHVEAQEARASAKERQAARRERNKAKKCDVESHAASRGVTHSHAESHDVTRRHTTSRQEEDEMETRLAEEKGTHPACAPAGVRVATAGPTPTSKAAFGEEASPTPEAPAAKVEIPPAQAPAAKADRAVQPFSVSGSAPAPMPSPSGDRASTAKPGPHAANPAGNPVPMTADDLRALWDAMCAKPGVEITPWPDGLPVSTLGELDGLARLLTPDGWRKVLERAAVSDLFNGRVKGGWTLDVFWLLKGGTDGKGPKNKLAPIDDVRTLLARIAAGAYPGGKGPAPGKKPSPYHDGKHKTAEAPDEPF
jgi:hypothetical protein